MKNNTMSKSIEEKIIDVLFEKNRINLVMKDDLARFLKERYVPEIKKSKLRKSELIEVTHKYLTPATLLDFATLDRFGLLQCDIEEILNVGKVMVKRLINAGKIRVLATVTDSRGSFSIKYHVCSIPDIIKVSKNENLKPKRTIQTKVNNLPETDENIARALYIINKSAKVSRDTKSRRYRSGDYRVCNAAKTRMLSHYCLKDAVIKKLIAENRMEFVGINKQELPDGNVQYLELYKIGRFSFHLPCEDTSRYKADFILENIHDLISADKSRDIKMTYRDAVYLLETYSGVHLTSDKD